ncbi:MAG TPA: ribonuclease P protein component [Caldisericia bacterium]|nr:ribonuclease P protein component [Caldisericia bacterium]HPB33529.1 ribonuclease P protein component [Caldisericia bacterium]HQL67068.1 ribonuclease P protein component [Caldisericia bacterium]HQN48699.1 ribonuclease P protein component [Caldisericia bacterium]HQP00171.1 ribonuclease P protein component [Caldisericia bacterium]
MGKLSERLTKKEIDELMREGIKIREKSLTFIYKKKESVKVAFIPVGTKKAVERNRLKRKVREIFLKYQDSFKKIWIAIIIPPFVIKRDNLVISKDFERFLWRVKNEEVDININ